MKALMKELLSLTEVRQLTEDVENGVSPVLITGVSPVHRAQVEAALHLETRRPLVVLCPDEREARRQAGDLRVLTGEEPLVLPARELQWRPDARPAASGKTSGWRPCTAWRSSPVVVTTADALGAAVHPAPGAGADGTDPGCGPAVGPGGPGPAAGRQPDIPAATRWRARDSSPCGAASWTCSPRAWSSRCAANFLTTRSTPWAYSTPPPSAGWKTVGEALLLPAAEVLPGCAEERTAEDAGRPAGGRGEAPGRGSRAPRPCGDLLTADAALLRQGVTPGGADRYMAAVYPEMTTALDYLSADALVCVRGQRPHGGRACGAGCGS